MPSDPLSAELFAQLDDDERRIAGLLGGMAEPFDVPGNLNHNVMAAVAIAEATEAMAEPAPHPQSRRRLPSWRPVVAGFAAAAAAAAIVLAVSDSGGPTVEIDATLAKVDGGTAGQLAVTRLGSGRSVTYETTALPILPKGELYEVWFVGPGDTPGAPNRISAGSFHPDENGKTDVTLHAAVDPMKYPGIEITAEPGNGNPGVDGPVVARR